MKRLYSFLPHLIHLISRRSPYFMVWPHCAVVCSWFRYGLVHLHTTNGFNVSCHFMIYKVILSLFKEKQHKTLFPLHWRPYGINYERKSTEVITRLRRQALKFRDNLQKFQRGSASNCENDCKCNRTSSKLQQLGAEHKVGGRLGLWEA